MKKYSVHVKHFIHTGVYKNIDIAYLLIERKYVFSCTVYTYIVIEILEDLYWDKGYWPSPAVRCNMSHMV